MKLKAELEIPERSKEQTLKALKLIEVGAQRDPIFLKGFVRYMEASLQVEAETIGEKFQS